MWVATAERHTISPRGCAVCFACSRHWTAGYPFLHEPSLVLSHRARFTLIYCFSFVAVSISHLYTSVYAAMNQYWCWNSKQLLTVRRPLRHSSPHGEPVVRWGRTEVMGVCGRSAEFALDRTAYCDRRGLYPCNSLLAPTVPACRLRLSI